MNKKFSTLVATLLLSGALFTVSAQKAVSPSEIDDKPGVELTENGMTLTEDVKFDDQKNYLVISQDNFVLDGAGHTLTGHIVITGNNVTVKNLTIDYCNVIPKSTGGINVSRAVHKTAITVIAESVTLDNNVINCSSDYWLANAITIFPTKEDAKIIVTNNTITGANPEANSWSSTGLQIVGDYNLANTGVSGQSGSTVKSLDKLVLTVSGNGYDKCSRDYGYSTDWSDTNKKAGTTIASQVTPLIENGKIVNGGALSSDINSAAENATITFNGTAEQLAEALEGQTINNKVAVNTNDGVVVSGVKQLDETLFGYDLVESATSNYSVLVLRSNNNSSYYAVSLDKDGVAQTTQIADVDDMKKFAEETPLWSMSTGEDSDGKVWFKFKNQEGKDLTVGGKTTFYSVADATYDNGVVFTLDGSPELKETEGTASVATNYFGLYTGSKLVSASDLNWFEKDGFSVTIKYKGTDGKFTKEDIAGNVFTGHLTPMSVDDITEAAADGDKEFYLKNANGDYIVAQKYAANGGNGTQATYTFTTVSEEALIEDIEHDGGKYFGVFQAEVSIKNVDMQALNTIDVLKVKIGNDWARLGRLDLGTDETPTLAASILGALMDIQISMGSNDLVQAKDLLKKGKFYTVELIASTDEDVKPGKLAVAGDQYDDTWVEFVSSYGNVLEGQWALTVVDGKYRFTNRETTAAYWDDIAVSSLYKTDKPNEYRFGTETYRIEVVPEHAATDGYRTLSDVKNTKFNLGFSSEVFEGNAWFVENHEGVENHTIGLNSDIDEALDFTATEYAVAREKKHNADHSYTYTPSDSIYVISTLGYYDGNTQKYTYDTLKVVSYSFVNQYTEPLIYNAEDGKYESKVYKDADKKVRYASVEEAAADADKFALRLDDNKLDGSIINLRVVDFVREAAENVAENSVSASEMYQIFAGIPMKVYAGDVKDGILNQEWMYSRPENDLFVVQETERPMYRPVVNALDTISLYRNDNPMSVLFEDKGFLGMENLAQYPEIAPAMVADTAYVRNETYRPQYMLVVNPDIHPAGKWCDVCGSADCEHAVPTAGWVEGRYLVNLVDTAYAWDEANKHKDGNPYINTEKYYRLGFVQATHRNDSLIIDGTKDTLFVGGEDYNQAKFAFRYDNLDDESFRIETANYKKLDDADEVTRDGEGWLKWMNGVVVVVDDIEDADIFNMNEEETGKPTDNEEITTSEVKVIAGDGQITINGAAGKKVVVSNILGQVVANTVITSDNATIAAPQGIVVVAVEGEEAVKAIVK